MLTPRKTGSTNSTEREANRRSVGAETEANSERATETVADSPQQVLTRLPLEVVAGRLAEKVKHKVLRRLPRSEVRYIYI